MIQSAVTISLVEEARGGPFVFWSNLRESCRKARELGFDAVELFAPGPDAVAAGEVHRTLDMYGLKLAAVGTGAGMVKHGLSLTDADAGRRHQAREFIRRMIEFGGQFGAPAIIGSMQGRFTAEVPRQQALGYLADALNELEEAARPFGVPLIYEPLNRYETNLVCTISDGIDFLQSFSADNVQLLADLFHMNIEEADVAAAIRGGRGYIGHVHFVDSNRQPAGRGHTDFVPIAAALRDIDYHGYASAEAFPIPDPLEAARLTIAAFHRYFR